MFGILSVKCAEGKYNTSAPAVAVINRTADYPSNGFSKVFFPALNPLQAIPALVALPVLPTLL